MSDAANLLSILRGELPVPPLADSTSPSTSPSTTTTTTTTRAAPSSTPSSGDHLGDLLSRLASPARAPAHSTSSNPLLSLLHGHVAPPPAPAPPVAPAVPNFNFVSPFDLLSSASNSASNSPSRAPPPPPPPPRAESQSIPTTYLSFSSVQSSSASTAVPGVRIPSSSLGPSPATPQALSISLEPNSHRDSLVTSLPVLTPITLFTPLPSTGPRRGAYRKLDISDTAIAYAVHPSTKKPKHAGIRIIDRDSGARVLLEKPFSATPTPIQVAHLEFSKATTANERGLLALGAEGSAAVWHGKDGFEQADGQDAQYRLYFIIKPASFGRKIVLARLHPSYPAVPKAAVVEDDNEVVLLSLNLPSESGTAASLTIPSLADNSERARLLSWKSPEDIRDIAFSPDGSLLAVLGLSTFAILATVAPDSPSAPGPLVVSQSLPTRTVSAVPSEIAFLSSTDPDSGASVMRGVAVSAAKGTQVDLFSLGPSTATRSPIVSIKLESPRDAGDAEYHASQLAYDPPSSTLFVSSSLRGSIFAFKIAYSSLAPDSISKKSVDKSESDVLRELVNASHHRSDGPSETRPSRSIRISHVVETPHPTPILQFVLDSKVPPAAEPSLAGGGALVLHSQGIQHVSLPPSPAPSSSLSKRHSVSAAAEAEAGGRRLGPEPGPHLSNPFSHSPLSSVPTPPLVAPTTTLSISRKQPPTPPTPSRTSSQQQQQQPQLQRGPPSSPRRRRQGEAVSEDGNAAASAAADDDDNLSPSLTAASTPTDELDRYLATGRRMSLEGSIHVQSEVEVDEDVVDSVSWEFMRRASLPIQDQERERGGRGGGGENERSVKVGNGDDEEGDKKREREVEDEKLEVNKAREEGREEGQVEAEDKLGRGARLGSVDEPVTGDIANALVTTTTTTTTDSTPTFNHDFAAQATSGRRGGSQENEDGNGDDQEIKLSGPVVNAAIKSMKAKKTDSFSNTLKNYSSPSGGSGSGSPPFASAAGAAAGVDASRSITSPVPATPTAQTQVPAQSRGTTRDTDGWKRLETELPRTIEDRVSRQLEKYLQRFEDERSGDQTHNTAREETLLKLVSQSVTKGTGRALETALNDMVLPAIEDVVGAEVERGLEAAVRKILPREISSVILDPEFTRDLAGSLVPTVEKTVTQLVLSGLVPSFKHTLHKSIDEILGEMRGEMVGVRKEIVREQSATVDKLDQEVGGLKKEVGELKTMLARMEKVMLAQQSSRVASAPVPAPAPAPVSTRPPPAAPTTSSATSNRSALSPRSTSKLETLPPIPRADTPPAKYEDLLTTLLQPSESPSFPSLVYFLNSSPPSRLDRIFPPPSSTTTTTSHHQEGPAISMAVTLSLAFRVSELIKSQEGSWSTDEQTWLEWLKRAIGACNDQQPPEFMAMIPRILDMVLTNLVTRGRTLMAVSDHRGAGEIRTVEQYARARLSMFH